MVRHFLQQLRHDWVVARRTHPRAVDCLVAVVGVAALGAAAGLWILVSLVIGLPDRQAISQIGDMAQATTVFDREDKLAFTIFRERRLEVPLESVSPHLVGAIIAIEDQRFYDHHGFDPVRMVAAMLANARHARVVQGGSTITQQLARQSFLTPRKTMHRKVQELVLAARIERTFSKPEILELYLNKVYFGDGLYGVEAASRGYFGKHASELSVPEAATLAGLVQSPSAYSPTVNADRALSRRNVVLQALFETGAIDESTWESARAAALELRDTLRAGEPHGQYFREQVRQELVERFGSERMYEDGLRVFSTIDMRAQVAAEESIAATLQTVEDRRKAIAARRGGARRGAVPDQPADPPLQAALVAMDPVTGHVRAMVGGRDFAESPFNRAMQARRQPGSAFKPFVFAAALEAGFTPASIVDRLDEPIPTFEGDWTPEDGHPDDVAQMSLRAALRTSSNRAAVRLLQEVGISSAATQAEAMGIGDQPEVPSLALGSGEVTLQTLTAAYAAFANQGRVPRPLLIRRVEDKNGQVLYAAEDSSTPAISAATAYLMADMLAGVIDAGTGARARQLGFKLPAGGKTGTTNDFKDAWFVGFTPRLIAGVWVGFDEPRTILPNGFASNVAVPAWASFMKAATTGDKAEWIEAPPSIVTAHICAESGKLATDACERGHVYTEFFAEGTEPTTSCDIHRPRNVLEAIASLFTSEEKPAPPGLEETGVRASVPPPPPTPQVAAPVVEPPPASEAPARKRGFWSRLFGRGRDGNQSDRGNATNSPAPSR